MLVVGYQGTSQGQAVSKARDRRKGGSKAEVWAKHLNQFSHNEDFPPYVQVYFAILDSKMFCTISQSWWESV